jgi:starch synthase
LGWIPDIIHCNDWQCGLVPAYLKAAAEDNELFNNFKTLFTIHNLAYQGIFPVTTFKKTGLPEQLNSKKGIQLNGKINFMKSGLIHSDVINTVSNTYAHEIRTSDEYGSGLKDVLSKRKNDLYGIINGIDTKVWNPEKDKHLPKKYNFKSIEAKQVNKEALTSRFGLEYKKDVPVFGIISRLYDSKGLDLIQKVFPDLMKLDLQFIVLGTGDNKYHKFLDKMSHKYKSKFACYLGFSDELAHLIEAGSDIFLMPSKYEPCGLNQMYSLTYGTIPIVHETGGLADTVIRYNEKTGEGTGFSFKKYDSKEFLKEIKRALKIFNDKKAWLKIVKAGMKTDFTWNSSAKKYIDLYKTILSNN